MALNFSKRLILIFLFVLINCADTPNKPVIQKELFGWAGAPEDINKKPHEYFYTKFYGKVEILSTKLKAENYQNKCIQSATKQAKEEILFRAMDWPVNDGPEDLDVLQLSKKYKKDYQAIFLKCNPIGYAYSMSIYGSKWRDCECIFYMKVLGGRDAIIAKVHEL